MTNEKSPGGLRGRSVRWIATTGHPELMDPGVSRGSSDSADNGSMSVEKRPHLFRGSSRKVRDLFAATFARRRLENQLRRYDRSLYGMGDWEDEVSIGGYGFSARCLSHLKLMFGPAADLHASVDTMWLAHCGRAASGRDRDLLYTRAKLKLGIRESGTTAKTDAARSTLLVDGQERPAAIWELQTGWGAIIELPDSLVSLQTFSARPGDVSLASLDRVTVFRLVRSMKF